MAQPVQVASAEGEASVQPVSAASSPEPRGTQTLAAAGAARAQSEQQESPAQTLSVAEPAGGETGARPCAAVPAPQEEFCAAAHNLPVTSGAFGSTVEASSGEASACTAGAGSGQREGGLADTALSAQQDEAPLPGGDTPTLTAAQCSPSQSESGLGCSLGARLAAVAGDCSAQLHLSVTSAPLGGAQQAPAPARYVGANPIPADPFTSAGPFAASPAAAAAAPQREQAPAAAGGAHLAARLLLQGGQSSRSFSQRSMSQGLSLSPTSTPLAAMGSRHSSRGSLGGLALWRSGSGAALAAPSSLSARGSGEALMAGAAAAPPPASGRHGRSASSGVLEVEARPSPLSAVAHARSRSEVAEASQAERSGPSEQPEAAATPDCFAALAAGAMRGSFAGRLRASGAAGGQVPVGPGIDSGASPQPPANAVAAAAAAPAGGRCSPPPFDASLDGSDCLPWDLPADQLTPSPVYRPHRSRLAEPQGATGPAAPLQAPAPDVAPPPHACHPARPGGAPSRLARSASCLVLPGKEAAGGLQPGPKPPKRVSFSLPGSPRRGEGAAAAPPPFSALHSSLDVDRLVDMLQAARSGSAWQAEGALRQGPQAAAPQAQQQQTVAATAVAADELGLAPSPTGSLDLLLGAVPTPTAAQTHSHEMQAAWGGEGRREQQPAGSSSVSGQSSRENSEGGALPPRYSGLGVEQAMAAVLASAGTSPTGEWGSSGRWSCQKHKFELAAATGAASCTAAVVRREGVERLTWCPMLLLPCRPAGSGPEGVHSQLPPRRRTARPAGVLGRPARHAAAACGGRQVRGCACCTGRPSYWPVGGCFAKLCSPATSSSLPFLIDAEHPPPPSPPAGTERAHQAPATHRMGSLLVRWLGTAWTTTRRCQRRPAASSTRARAASRGCSTTGSAGISRCRRTGVPERCLTGCCGGSEHVTV